MKGPLTPEERIDREKLRAADDLLPNPGGMCSIGNHDRCMFRVDCPCPCHDTGALLTADEHKVIDLAGELWGYICHAIPGGPTRDADLRELIVHIHAIQHAVMANAAARAYPHLYRTLGGTIRQDNQ